ncbi:hypothetical protein ATCC90586_009484 [Pythium insidiosum]|nr:hypothetical protein ATCC90586_009484 [Pythium insidiosum]
MGCNQSKALPIAESATTQRAPARPATAAVEAAATTTTNNNNTQSHDDELCTPPGSSDDVVAPTLNTVAPVSEQAPPSILSSEPLSFSDNDSVPDFVEDPMCSVASSSSDASTKFPASFSFSFIEVGSDFASQRSINSAANAAIAAIAEEEAEPAPNTAPSDQDEHGAHPAEEKAAAENDAANGDETVDRQEPVGSMDAGPVQEQAAEASRVSDAAGDAETAGLIEENAHKHTQEEQQMDAQKNAAREVAETLVHKVITTCVDNTQSTLATETVEVEVAAVQQAEILEAADEQSTSDATADVETAVAVEEAAVEEVVAEEAAVEEEVVAEVAVEEAAVEEAAVEEVAVEEAAVEEVVAEEAAVEEEVVAEVAVAVEEAAVEEVVAEEAAVEEAAVEEAAVEEAAVEEVAVEEAAVEEVVAEEAAVEEEVVAEVAVEEAAVEEAAVEEVAVKEAAVEEAAVEEVAVEEAAVEEVVAEEAAVEEDAAVQDATVDEKTLVVEESSVVEEKKAAESDNQTDSASDPADVEADNQADAHSSATPQQESVPVTYQIAGTSYEHGVMMYLIQKTDGKSNKWPAPVSKRYSEFCDLHRKLQSSKLPHASSLPALPKGGFSTFLKGRQNKKTVEARQKTFDSMLKFIASKRELANSDVFQKFINH